MATPKSRIIDQISYLHPGARRSIFYIPGNPGLISYYRTFLQRLNDNLNTNIPPSARINIYGRSLGGFEVEPEHQQSRLFSLQDQIKFVESNLIKYADLEFTDSGERPQIILIGHSVGTYIALEILRRQNEAAKIEKRNFDLVKGILLFPTVVDIAKSPTGKRVNFIGQLSFTPWLLSSIAAGLSYALPGDLLFGLVKTVTGMPDDGAAVTTAFLRSRLGVQQALTMGRDELNEMKEDVWKEDIWGAPNSPAKTELFFYFGQNDHWIAEETRDAIIAGRGRLRGSAGGSDWKPLMQIDELGISHSFCLLDSDVIAERVAEYILQDMI